LLVGFPCRWRELIDGSVAPGFLEQRPQRCSDDRALAEPADIDLHHLLDGFRHRRLETVTEGPKLFVSPGLTGLVKPNP
jgi:hypothetical protein